MDGDYTYLLPVGALYRPSSTRYMLPILGLAASGVLGLGRSGLTALILLGAGLESPISFWPAFPTRISATASSSTSGGHTGRGRDQWLAADPPGLVGPHPVRRGGKRWSQGGRLVAAACLLGMVVWGLRSADRFISVHNGEKAIARQIEASLPRCHPPGLLPHPDPEPLHRSGRGGLYHQDAASLEAHFWAEPLYLVLDPGSVARQWQGRPLPQLPVAQDHRTLTPSVSSRPTGCFALM